MIMTYQNYFSLPVTLFTRLPNAPAADWVEVDTGPGTIRLPEGQEYGFRIHTIGDEELAALVKELAGLQPITYANLSENRKITDDGVELLKTFPRLTYINLSSCGLSNEGLAHLPAFTHLTTLDLSYCNRLTGPALKHLRTLPNLQYLNLQGCIKITNGDVARFKKRGLTINK
jgi:hypothetical protein